MLPLRPATQASRSFFSLTSRLVSGFSAFSAPLGCLNVSACPLVLRMVERVTYAKLDGNGEEVTASLLGNSIAAWNTWEVDEGWGNDALFAAKTLEDGLCEAVYMSVKPVK